MRRVVVHVGGQKTGSTALQKLLTRNARILEQHGVLYPHAGRGGASPNCHHILAIRLRDAVAEAATPVLREWLKSPAETLLVSSEMLVEFDSARALREAFRPFPVEIVLWIRQQEEWIESLYRMTVVGASQRSTWLPWEMPAYWPSGDWHLQWERFSRVFGHDAIRVHRYAPRSAEDLPRRLFADLGLAWPLPGLVTPGRADSNISLGVEALEVKRFTNRVPRSVAEDLRIGEALRTVPRSHRETRMVPEDVLVAVRDAYAASNEALDTHIGENLAPSKRSPAEPFRGLDGDALWWVASHLERSGLGSRVGEILAPVDLNESRRAWQR